MNIKAILNKINFINMLAIFHLLNSCGYIDEFNNNEHKLESFDETSEIYASERMTDKLAESSVIIKRETEYSSGVIIAKQNARSINTLNTYFVVTTKHSVDTPPGEILISKDEDINDICPAHKQKKSSQSKVACEYGNYYLTSIDNKIYAVDYSSIVKHEKFDFALLKFVSGEDYIVTPIASNEEMKVKKDSPVFIAGYRGCDNQQGLGTNNAYQLSSGFVKKDATDSYDLLYKNSTVKGMSGAGVFNQQGKLIAIHTRASRSKNYDYQLCQSLEEEDNQLGDNWGTVIPSQFIKDNLPKGVKMKECSGIARNSFC